MTSMTSVMLIIFQASVCNHGSYSDADADQGAYLVIKNLNILLQPKAV